MDTLAAHRTLTEAGFDARQADALVHVLQGSTVTKADLDRVEAQLVAKIDALGVRFDPKIDAVESRLSARMDRMDARIDRLELKVNWLLAGIVVVLLTQIVMPVLFR